MPKVKGRTTTVTIPVPSRNRLKKIADKKGWHMWETVDRLMDLYDESQAAKTQPRG